MGYSHEQLGVIQSPGHIIAVNAFAGTGKTFTLVGRAEAHPQQRILVCMLNRANALEAKARFPSANTVSCTSHSLAFKAIGKHFAHKLGEIKPYQLVKHLTLPFGGHKQQELAASIILATLRNFMTSADMTLEEHHVPINEAARIGIAPYEILRYAREVWNEQIQPDSALPFPHDGYLKLYQLVSPQLTEFDTILLDEAQDLNPVTLAIMQAQTHADHVLVGDRHQSIYGFRQTVDALSIVEADDRHYLTQSYRFGEAIAETANALLHTFKHERQTLKGLGDDSHVGPLPDRIGHHAILCRTNAGIFDAAVDFINNHGERPIAFAGGLKGYALNQLMDTHALRKGEPVRDPYIGSFKSYEDLEEYAENVDDKELKSRVRVLERYGNGVPRFVAMIRSMEAENPDHAVVTFSTAHKSKGLEWDYVKLWNDYPALVDKHGMPLTPENVPYMRDDEEPVDVEEVNLQYVAATRARTCLDVEETSLEACLKSPVVKKAMRMRNTGRDTQDALGKLDADQGNQLFSTEL